MLLGYFELDSGHYVNVCLLCLFIGSSIWISNWVDFNVGCDSRIWNFNLNSDDSSVVVIEFLCYV